MMPAGGRLNGGERFAIDWVRFDLADDPLTTLHGDISRNLDYLAYDADVLAVADGTVVSVVSDMPDEPPQQAPTDLGIDQLGGRLCRSAHQGAQEHTRFRWSSGVGCGAR